MPLPLVKAIVFDAYGTLLDIRTIDQLLRELFGEKAGNIAAVWRQKQLEYTWLRTLMGRYKNFEAVTRDGLVFACKVAQAELTDAHILQLMEAYDRLLVYEDVRPALDRLKNKYRLAVLSNANPRMLESALAYNEVAEKMELILSADEAKLFKPRPEVYQLAVQKLNLSPEEILFISSNTWDVAGAKSFGLKVAWANRFDGYIEELGFEPDLIIENLEALAGKLDG